MRLRKCAGNGLSSDEVMPCGTNQYCDVASSACKTGVCAPNQPACDGKRATEREANEVRIDGRATHALDMDAIAVSSRFCWYTNPIVAKWSRRDAVKYTSPTKWERSTRSCAAGEG